MPTAMASRYRNGRPISGVTQSPPCGARRVLPKAIDRPPVTALPSMIDGITRSGSAAANGIAPSVMNEAPSSQAAAPFSRSASVNSFGRSTVASASASGGVIPAAITAAMIFSCGASVAVPRGEQAGGGERVGDLVDRAAHVERHHQAEQRRRA